MKLYKTLSVYLILIAFSAQAFAQTPEENKVVITGARFTYPLVNQWIAEYKELNPSVTVVIEPRTTADPASYDLLIEAYDVDATIKEQREFLYLGRYPLVLVANASSELAKVSGEKGLTNEVVKQIFFHDLYADKEKQEEIKFPYTVYTRQQKSGPPITFSAHFGFVQQQINGKGIAGSDEHLLKATLADPTSVSYNHPGLLYDLTSRQLKAGLKIIPLDADDNGRVANDEKFYASLDQLLDALETEKPKNIPTGDLHLSVSKRGYKPEALKFLQWVSHRSQEDLRQFGFLKPDQKRFETERAKFDQLARK